MKKTFIKALSVTAAIALVFASTSTALIPAKIEAKAAAPEKTEAAVLTGSEKEALAFDIDYEPDVGQRPGLLIELGDTIVDEDGYEIDLGNDNINPTQESTTEPDAEAPADVVETITSGDVTISINKTTRAVEITGEGAMEEPLYNHLVTKEHYLEAVKGAMGTIFGTEVDLVYDEELTDIIAIDNSMRYYDHETGEELVVDEDVRLALNPASFLEVSPLTITIGEGITSIPDYAFLLCNDVETVIIPKSVQSIGDAAFLYCGNLKRVVIPENATIGESAFNYCYKLEAVIIAADEYYAPAQQSGGGMTVGLGLTSFDLTVSEINRLIYC